ncbi:MAG: Ger(x)C family spore germination protein [Oscillospiraceae bacterium]|nr:Ger(x)C family spore germination protein [Oscillospiraceae bacterium]
MRRKFIAFTLSAFILLSFSGCNSGNIYLDHIEIDRLELIQTIGFDFDEGLITATASSGINQNTDTPAIISDSAKTSALAVKAIQNYAEKKHLFFSHTENILIGFDAAKSSLSEIIDYIKRDIDTRLDISLFILKSERADEIIFGSSGKNSSVTDILNSIKKDAPTMSDGYVFSFGEIASSLAYNGCAVISAIKSDEKKTFNSENSDFSLTPVGYAVIKNDRLAGFLDKDSSKGVNLLMHKAETDYVALSDGHGGLATLKVTPKKTKISPVYKDDKLSEIKIDITLSANIEELSSDIDIADHEFLSLIKTELSQTEASYILNAVNASQNMSADFMNLEKKLQLSAPLKFNVSREEWNEIFPSLKITVAVSSDIERTYDIGSRLNGRERNDTLWMKIIKYLQNN